MTQDFRIRLLIVDDEQTIRRLCITVGESLGFFCLEAESGDAALALLEEQPVHMVLTDMVMPRMSGIECTVRLKELLPKTQIIILTAMDDQELVFMALEAGADEYVMKPFDRETLHIKLQLVGVA